MNLFSDLNHAGIMGGASAGIAMIVYAAIQRIRSKPIDLQKDRWWVIIMLPAFVLLAALGK